MVLCCVLSAVAVGTSVAVPVAAAATREPVRVDLGAVPPGAGVVFGSILVRWAAPGNAGEYDIGEQEFTVFPESMPGRDRKRDRAAAALRVEPLKEREFLLQLPAGQYDIFDMYRATKGVMGWRPKHDILPVSVGAHFQVQAGEVTYVGRLVVEMPQQARSASLSAGLMFVDPSGYLIENARETAVAALQPTYGERLSSAATALMRAPDDLLTGDFQQARAGDRVRIGTRHWEMLLPPGTEPTARNEVHQPRAHETWIVFTGDTVDIATAGEGLEIVLWETDHFFYTPRTFFETMRQTQGQPGSSWRVLEEDAHTILYEVITPLQGAPRPYQIGHSLFRIQIGERHAVSVMYVCLGELPDSVREEWLAALRTARIAY
jgi:hypothetical protein